MSLLPDPWAADTPQLLTGILSQRAECQLLTAAGDEVPLDLLAGRVTFDERTAPRAQATLECGVPTDAALLDRIDSRTGCRLTVKAGYVRAGGVFDGHQLVDLALRDRRVRRPANVMSLDAAGDESLVIDAAATLTGTVVEATTTAAIATVVRQVLPAAAFSTLGASSAGPAINQSQVDTDRWDTVQDLADRIGLQVFDDGSRLWVMRDAPVLAAPTLTIRPGAGGILLESDSSISRDEWANWVVLRYVWTDAGNVRQRVVGSRRVTTGPYAAAGGNIKIFLEDRQTPTTQAQADAAAAALVARMVTRGRGVVISSPAAYWVRPGDTVLVQLPTGDDVALLVAAVEFDLLAGTMRITTRLPDNTGAIGA